MNRYAIVFWDGRYIPVLEAEMKGALSDLKVHSIYVGHVAAAHRFCELQTEALAKPRPTGEVGLEVERVKGRRKGRSRVPYHLRGRR